MAWPALGTEPTVTASSPLPRPPKPLMAAVLIVGLWGATPPWSGPWLGWGVAGVPTDIEVVDHAVPGAILVAVAVAGLAGRLPLAAALVSVLASLWMTATHVPLLNQAAQGRVTLDSALFHSLPGLVLLPLTVAAAAWAWRADARAETQTDPRHPAGEHGSG